MKKTFVLSLMLLACVSLSGCYWNVRNIKVAAPARFAEAGFSIVAIEGTIMSPTGGRVWYLLEKTDGKYGLYQGALSYMFSGDLGIYSLSAVDSSEIRISK